MLKLYHSEKEVENFASGVDNSFQNVAEHFVSIMREQYEISENERLDTMLDVGCGSGGSTRMFAPYFKSIVAFDPSESQINLAKKMPCAKHITYLVGSGEKMPVEDACADMIVSCWAIHLMDIDEFVSELRRVLKPKGRCFSYGYEYIDFTPIGNERGVSSVQGAYHRYCARLKAFYEDNYPLVKKKYDRYESIYNQITKLKKIRIDDLTHQSDVMSLLEFRNYLLSIPEHKACCEGEEAKGKSSPLDDLVRDIKTIWGVDDKAETEIQLRFTFWFYVLCLHK